MEIVLTNHAIERMEQREIPDPNFVTLHRVGKSKRRKIKEACRKNGMNTKEYIYLACNKIIYVLTQIDTAKLKLITAFKIR